MIEHMSEQEKAVKAMDIETGVRIAAVEAVYRELDRGADKEGKYKAEIAQKSLFS